MADTSVSAPRQRSPKHGSQESMDVQIALSRLVKSHAPAAMDVSSSDSHSRGDNKESRAQRINDGQPAHIDLQIDDPVSDQLADHDSNEKANQNGDSECQQPHLIQDPLGLCSPPSPSPFPDGFCEAMGVKSRARKSRVALIPFYIIVPESRLHRAWLFILLVLLAYTVFVMPWRIAFADADAVFIADIVVDVFFGLDVVISFFTAYENNRGRLETDQYRITSHYLSTYFIIDIVSIFPFFLFVRADDGLVMSVLRVPRLIKLLKLVRIVKLLRNYRLRSLLISVEYSPYVHQKLLRIVELAAVVLAFAHFSACIWYYLGAVYREQNIGPGISWIERVGGTSVFQESDWYKYTLALYWSLSTLTTVGYGDISAQTPAELVFAMLSMIMGSTVFAYTTATVASMIRERDQRAQHLRDKMSRLRTFASAHNLSNRLRSSLTKRMNTIWTAHSANEGRHMAELMNEFPSDLAIRVTAEVHRDLIERSSFTSTYSDRPNFILSLFRQLLPLKLVQGEMLAHQGDHVHNWYIVESGEVRAVHPVYPTVVVYQSYTFGQTLGDIGLFQRSIGGPDVWLSSIRCTSTCRLWLIDGDTFMKMVSHFGFEERFRIASQEKAEEMSRAISQADRKISMLENRISSPTELAMTVPAAMDAIESKRRLSSVDFSVLTRTPSHFRDDATSKFQEQARELAEAIRQVKVQFQALELAMASFSKAG
uniref:Cyclic nucleotide-binding domain-containing protein n=2 Tax=Spongospora subterranea TaxID=70186 RepID=A0A0H5RAP8_9EUKA|eukprot:CRZ11138.1 hypothetical protein [Spongospora subterranea]